MAVIDLSQLPAPQIVDMPDFETLLAERKAEFVALHPKDEQEAVIRTLELESEPVTKLLQENAYRELLLRQRINEAAQAVMVAYAMGGDLDQLAANYNVKRLTVTPADNDTVPPVAAADRINVCPELLQQPCRSQSHAGVCSGNDDRFPLVSKQFFQIHIVFLSCSMQKGACGQAPFWLR